MKKFKITVYLLAALALAALGIVLRLSSVRAADFSGFGGSFGATPIALSNGVTTVSAGTAFFWILPGDSRYQTNTGNGGNAPSIKVSQGQGVAFQLSTFSADTTASNHTVVFVTSLDQLHWDTVTPYVLPMHGAVGGQTQSTNFNNFTGYIAPWYMTNASASDATNVTLLSALPGF